MAQLGGFLDLILRRFAEKKERKKKKRKEKQNKIGAI